jgi:hypothetical protein
MMSANCEGCEYGMLENLLETRDDMSGQPLITQFHTIQLSRHGFPEIPDVVSRYCRISEKLQETHEVNGKAFLSCPSVASFPTQARHWSCGAWKQGD